MVRGGALLIAIVLSGCRTGTSRPRSIESPVADSTKPAALAIDHTWLLAGETMEFELSLHGIVGGIAHVAVGEPGIVADRQVIIVRSRLETTGVVALMETVSEEAIAWIDIDSGLPIYLKADHKSGDLEIVLETRFGAGAPGSFTVDTQSTGVRERFRYAMPSRHAALDPHAMLGALRAWDGKIDEQAVFYVLAAGSVWQSTIRMTAREHVHTLLGRAAAVRIDAVASELSPTLGEIGPRSLHCAMWISDDAERRPLLVRCDTKHGAARVELTRYWRPRDGVAATDGMDIDQ